MAARRHGPGLRLVSTGLLVLVSYVVAARLGFQLAFVAEQVTTVWAPTGIALAALLLGGYRLWPAVWLGAFLANLDTRAPLWAAAIVAAGNTLEAVVAAWGLRRVPGFDPGLRRVADVIAFILIAVAMSTTVSATVGVVTLCAAGVQPWNRFTMLWGDWFLGDALGALVVAPAILTTVRSLGWSSQRWVRTSGFVASAVLATYVVFSSALGAGAAHPLEYVVFPFVIAAAVLGGPAATALVVLSASVVAIWGTVHGAGPFGGREVHGSLILLQTFTGALAGTGLLLAAAIAEREASERRERGAVQELQEREQILRLAQRAGGVAAFEWDFRNQVAQCSAEFFRIFGMPERDGTMTGAEWGQFVHPDDRERMAAHLVSALEGSEPAATDYRIIAADGSTRWLSYAGQVQRTPHGDRMLGTVVDITDRKRLEDELRRHARAAESANQLKDEFLATLSHELRTPLNAILGYVQMLQTNAIPPEKRQHAIEIIERNAVAQNQLVQDLLDMSRITTGKIRLEPEPLAIGDILREAIEGVRPAAHAKGITIDVELDSASVLITADATRLRQVFWNLLSNAVKFTGQGGRVLAQLDREDPYVKVAISDTGVGISAEFLPFVFEAFRQGDARSARDFGGLGLGLAICRQLVELHGGTIHAASAGTGRGATFTIRLPQLIGGAVMTTKTVTTGT